MEEPSPRSKVCNILKNDDKKIIGRKLLFGEILKNDLMIGYKKLKVKTHRLVVQQLLLKNKKSLKKYKMMKEYNFISSKNFSIIKTRTKGQMNIRNLRLKSIKTGISQEIQDFFERDDVSGKRDSITVKKVKKQKSLLLGSLKNLYKKFCEMNKQYKISYTTFCRFRPFWVIIPRVSNRDTYACRLHANAELLVGALHKAGVIDKSTPNNV